MDYKQWSTKTITDNKITNVIDAELTYYLPTVWDEIKAVSQLIVPLTTSHWKSEEQFIKGYIKNINLDIYKNSSSIPVMYSFPMISNRVESQLLWFLPTSIAMICYSIIKLSNNPLTVADINRKTGIITFNKMNYNIALWETIGLRALISDERIRTSIVLHELGHWVYGAIEILSIIQFKSLLLSTALLSYIMIIINCILFIIASRCSEIYADKFVKDCGYGNELATGLDMITFHKFNISSKKTIFIKIYGTILNNLVKLHNIIDKYLPITPKISVERRIRSLKEIEIISDYEIINEGVYDAIRPILAKLINPIDTLVSDNMHHIFPTYLYTK